MTEQLVIAVLFPWLVCFIYSQYLLILSTILFRIENPTHKIHVSIFIVVVFD